MSSKLGEIKIDGTTMNRARAARPSGGHAITGKSDIGADAVSEEYRRRKAKADLKDNHGPVKYIIRDGKPVEEKT